MPRYSPETKVALLLTRIIIDDTSTTDTVSIMKTVRSCVPILKTMIPQAWTDDDLLEKARSIPAIINPFWRLGLEIYGNYKESRGQYTGSEKRIRELIALARGLRF